jgi:SAM-dependent methyltransferase
VHGSFAKSCAVLRRAIKRAAEFSYWLTRRLKGGPLGNSQYEFFFTTHFGLDSDFYRDKSILDVGCGPRGSLEWATHAKRRVGVDPLANQYLRLGARAHEMEYVNSGVESMPFPDGEFDVVSSINSLDHVDDLDEAVAEICRVLKPGGTFLLVTDVNHDPTITEPLKLTWDVAARFSPPLRPLEVLHLEKDPDGMLPSAKKRVLYDHEDPRTRYGVLSVVFEKPLVRAR